MMKICPHGKRRLCSRSKRRHSLFAKSDQNLSSPKSSKRNMKAFASAPLRASVVDYDWSLESCAILIEHDWLFELRVEVPSESTIITDLLRVSLVGVLFGENTDCLFIHYTCDSVIDPAIDATEIFHACSLLRRLTKITSTNSTEASYITIETTWQTMK